MAEFALIAIVSINLGFLVVGIGWLLGYWDKSRPAAAGLTLLLFAALVSASTADEQAGISTIEAVVFSTIVLALLMTGIGLSRRARA